ncbi:peptide-methionine (R)-S-oxide reductase MsrB [Oceanimonas sp. NS1]|nr:peptide-methionine (R)-S-oxide reductase MsrB [Oceanimonas sp. NS1]
MCTGTTRHAEAIQITYDSDRIGPATLLKVFFGIAHDPTQLNRQGHDTGTQYRSAVFWQNEQERTLVERYIDLLEQAGAFKQPIVTTLEPLDVFYPAETHHQDYAAKHPDQPYIAAVARPKVAKVQHYYKHQLKRTSDMAQTPSPYDLSPARRGQAADPGRRAEPGRAPHSAQPGHRAALCGGLLDNHEDGCYVCRLCAPPLFSSACKFESGSGWPSFYAPYHPDHIRELADMSHGMRRVEIRCARCDGHLGHVFPDGPPPTGLRYCLNSASMQFCHDDEPKPDPLKRGETGFL